jgi:hypothetical protein
MPCMRKARLGLTLLLGSGCTGLLWPALAQAQSEEELAKKLNNPVAAMISVPIQVNYDERYGTAEQGHKWTINVQPVIPFQLNAEWNLISRTILPIVSQSDVLPGSSQSGIGDITQSLFFSPKEPTAAGWVWGAGPAFLLPTATDDLLGAEQWAIGPTAVVLKQTPAGWTYGALVNHLWSVAGADGRADVNATLLQPFLAKVLGQGRTLTLNSETTYDWSAGHWNVPINCVYTKVTLLAKHRISWGGGARVYLESPDGGADWGLRVVVTLLLPQ